MAASSSRTDHEKGHRAIWQKNQKITFPVLKTPGRISIVKKIIDDYEEKIKKLQIQKDNTIKKLEETLENNKTQENKKIDKKIEDCDNEDKNELKNNVEKHQTDKDAIRKKYQEEIKLRNEQLKIEDKETKNKYKLMKEKEKIYSQYKIEELKKIVPTIKTKRNLIMIIQ